MTFFNRKFGYVEFSCEEDMQKALELNGKKLMGQEIKLDKARSKENSQDCKKGAVGVQLHTTSNRIAVFTMLTLSVLRKGLADHFCEKPSL